MTKATSARLSSDPYELYIAVAGELPKATNKLLGAHWKHKHGNAVKWKTIVQRACLNYRPAELLSQARITIIRHHYRMLDYDGLVASQKPVVDGLKGLILKDDTWKITGPWKVDQRFRAKAEGPLLEIWIREVKLEN